MNFIEKIASYNSKCVIVGFWYFIKYIYSIKIRGNGEPNDTERAGNAGAHLPSFPTHFPTSFLLHIFITLVFSTIAFRELFNMLYNGIRRFF